MHNRLLNEQVASTATFAKDDRIFLGEGLFETLKVVNEKPCFAASHWQRMADAARQLGIPFDWSFAEWHEALIQQLKRDELCHGGIKVILSGGSAPRGLAEHGQMSQLLLQTFNYTAQTHPLKLLSAPWLRDAANPVYQLKSVNYLEAVLARRQALACGADDALFFNMQHCATDTTCANIFVITNNKLVTPPLSDGVLPGITRSRVIDYCRQHHISCLEQSITKPMIESSDLVFTTNALQGIRLVASLDDRLFQLEHLLVEQLILELCHHGR